MEVTYVANKMVRKTRAHSLCLKIKTNVKSCIFAKTNKKTTIIFNFFAVIKFIYFVIKYFYKLLTSPTIDNSYNSSINIMTFNALKT